MRHVAMLLILVPLAISVALAQDDPAVQPAAAELSETPAVEEAEQTSPLEALGWMVGEWVDQGEDATVITECSWTKNRKFLKRSYRVQVNEEAALEGDQFVGWDPLAGQIRSWTFDSAGGFGEGVWIQDGDRWLVKASFVLADGSRASALNVYTYVDDNQFRWQSTNREIAGELQPSIPEVTVVLQQAAPVEQQSAESADAQGCGCWSPCDTRQQHPCRHRVSRGRRRCCFGGH